MVDDDSDLAAFPPELIDHIACQAIRDADRVVEFFTAIGLYPLPDPPPTFSAGFLLEFAAALRIWAWQSGGIDTRSDGLPEARAAARQILEEASDRHCDPSLTPPGLELSRSVFEVTVNGWAWTGQKDLHADIRLDFADEDTLIDALADFLWSYRNVGGHYQEPNKS